MGSITRWRSAVRSSGSLKTSPMLARIAVPAGPSSCWAIFLRKISKSSRRLPLLPTGTGLVMTSASVSTTRSSLLSQRR